MRRRLLYTLLLCCWPCALLHAAVTFETASEGNTGSPMAATLTIAHNNSAVSNANRLLVLGVSTACSTACPADAATATWNGTSVNQVAVITTGGTKTWVYTLVNPTLGSFNVVFTPSNSQRMAGGVVTLAGVDQGSPTGTVDTESCSSATTCTATVTVPTDGGGVGVGGKQDTTDALVTATQTERTNDCSTNASAGANRCTAVSTTTTTGSQNFTFNNATGTENLNAIAVPINAAAAGGAGRPA